MADDEKHENPVDTMLIELQDLAGFQNYVITNNQGIVLKYHNVEYDVAVQTVTQVLDLMQKSKLVLQKVMDPAENELENLRLKSDNYEMIVSQHGNFTMIVNQSFKIVPTDGEEEGAEGAAPAAE